MYFSALFLLVFLTVGDSVPLPSLSFSGGNQFEVGDMVYINGTLPTRATPGSISLFQGRQWVMRIQLWGRRGKYYIKPLGGTGKASQRRAHIRSGSQFEVRIKRKRDSYKVFINNQGDNETANIVNDVTQIKLYGFERAKIAKVEKYKYTCQSSDRSCGLTSVNIDVPRALCPPSTSNQGRIVGGTPASAGQNPWQVAFRERTTTQLPHTCGGILIDTCWVLSAAHCFQRPSFRRYNYVRVGDYNNRDGTEKRFGSYEKSQDINIRKILKHIEFDILPSTVNDIALVRLEESSPGQCAIFNDFVKPACLPTSTNQFTTDEECTITGWGATEHRQALANYPSCLQQAGVDLKSQEECRKVYTDTSRGPRIISTMVCAEGKGNIDACQGDSGGPLVCQDANNGPMVVWGITSWGEKCGTNPGVYTKVVEFMDWIEETMSSYCNYDPFP